ncbi:MAG: FG-GAP repeat protein [Planctomycetota bacterium]|nr:FG-GAP repeat protein [Planctomycetota bacterium]
MSLRSALPIIVFSTFSAGFAAAYDELSAADRSAIQVARYAVAVRADVCEARNPAHAWIARIDARGFVVRPTQGSWSFGLALHGATATNLQASGNSVALERGSNIVEWWCNDARGLEHGLTLRAPIERESESMLRLAFDVLGDLQAVVEDGARSVSFVDERGSIRARYTDLIVIDALDRELAARFECSDGRLHFVVDDRDAQYPLTIDPLAQQAYFKASNADAGDLFGCAIAVSGNTVVIGAPSEASGSHDANDDGSPGAGAAYVFFRNGTIWTQQAYLKASTPEIGDAFGASVAISRDTIVVGAPGEDSHAHYTNGDEIDNSAHNAGAAYVFTRQGFTWTQTTYVKASNSDAFDAFGTSVAVCTDTIVIGAPGEASAATGINGDEASNSAPDAGAAYVLSRSGSTWNETAYFKASNTGSGDRFGQCVALAGHSIVVGAPGEDSTTLGVNGVQTLDQALDSGAAYVYAKAGLAWTQQAFLKASNTDAFDAFGAAVAIAHVPATSSTPSGTDATTPDGGVQGAPGPAGGSAGHPGSWASAPDVVVVGAPRECSSASGVNGDESSDATIAAGAAYVFVRNSTTWHQRAYLKANHADVGDHFGSAVSITEFGDVIAVGAPGEDGSSHVVGGDVLDDALPDSGAAYVFAKLGAGFVAATYVKATNPGVGDGFGSSISISLGNLAVGSPFEDGGSRGVNGPQSDESRVDSGAAYEFVIASHTSPSVFCVGDGQGAACPRRNSGASNSGCANSTFASGARLEASGLASVATAHDTLTLTASGVSGPVLFVQGAPASGLTGYAFGDGLLCVSSSTVLLGVVMPVTASATIPNATSPQALHSAGGVNLVGAVRAYQALYRDAMPYCTNSLINTTSALLVTWGE